MTQRDPDKILMTTGTIGGVWTYAIELINALHSHDVHVVLATMGDKISAEQREELTRLKNLTLYESEYKLEWMPQPWKDVDEAGNWLLKIAEKENPDLIHLNSYSFGSLNWQKPVLMVAHGDVYTCWNALHGEDPPQQEWEEYFHRVKFGMHAADIVIAPTHAYLKSLEKVYKKFNRSGYIYNCRNSESFKPRQKEPFLFSMGRLWDEAKNIIVIEEVAQKLTFPVYIAGNYQQPNGDSDIEAQKAEMLGHIPAKEISAWLGRASVYALPARYEPFGISAIEAAFAGCALVLNDTETLREVWGNDALFCKAENPDEVHKKVHKLLENEELRDEMAERAHKRAQCYKPAITAAKYMEAYDLLLKGLNGEKGLIVEDNRHPHQSKDKNLKEDTLL